MAPPQKRKISYLEDSDDDEPSLGRQVLPIANLPSDFDGEPVDGLQYLFLVRRDARLLPHFTRVPNPYTAEQVVDLMTDKKAEEEEQASSLSLPSEEWREVFSRRFKNFRANSTQPTIHTHNRVPGKLTPDKKDRDAWWAFVSGRPETEWNPPKKPKQSKAKRYATEQRYSAGLRAFSDNPEITYEEIAEDSAAHDTAHDTNVKPTDRPTPTTTPAPEVPEIQDVHLKPSIFTAREPTPTIIKHIDHRYAIHLLMYFAHWINLYLEEPDRLMYHINDTHARWMFVLLSRVEDYISADEMSTLRSLARACMALIKHNRARAQLRDADSLKPAGPDTPMHELSGWLIITAIAGIWGQRDLWSDAETVLASV